MQLCECSCCSISDTKMLCAGRQLGGGPLNGKNASSQPDLIGHKALAADLILLQL